MPLLHHEPVADPLIAAKAAKERGHDAASALRRLAWRPAPLQALPATSSAASLEDLLPCLSEACRESELLAKAIDMVRREAARMPEIEEVYRTRLGRFPNFIFVTSNTRYDPELDRKIMALDRLLVDQLPGFRFDLLCFPRMKADPQSLIPGDKELVYRRRGSLHAPA